jgi:hypothetical protein
VALGLQLHVGSRLEQGDWNTNGVWKPSAPHQDIIPPHLQQIHADDLAKVGWAAWCGIRTECDGLSGLFDELPGCRSEGSGA